MKFCKSASVAIYFILSALLLTACSGGGDASQPEAQVLAINGGAVKGPLINAVVTVYAFDSSQVGFKGVAVDVGATDASAAIIGLNLPLPLVPPYIMEFTSSLGTTDLTTGSFPIIPTLTTVLTQALIDTGDPVYATPLTTLAVDIAINNSTSTTTPADFLAKISAAASQVIKTVGFGMSVNVDIFDSPPLIDDTIDTTAELTDVLAYRTAIEALTSIVFLMQQDASSIGDVETIVSELANDLSDGAIDASVNGTPSAIYDSTTLTIFIQDPTGVIIPNTTETVADVPSILVNEMSSTGSTGSAAGLSNGAITVTIAPASTTPASQAVWNNFNWSDGSTWQ